MQLHRHPYLSNDAVYLDCGDLFIRRLRMSYRWPFRCHRCKATTQIIGRHPYCTECNWDSLTDVSWGKIKCAA